MFSGIEALQDPKPLIQAGHKVFILLTKNVNQLKKIVRLEQMFLNYYKEPFKFISKFNDTMYKKNFLRWHKDCSPIRKFLARARLAIS